MKVPVYVISGFLGSGKTTILLNLLKECEKNNQRPGIILNELGEINVESHMFKDQNIQELLNGCICCSIQDDLKETLDYFANEAKENNIDVLFIEGTGVANPIEIEEVLLNNKYLEIFQLQSMISLVDASNYLEYQSIFSSTAEVRKLLQEQISSATFVLLNKADLVKEKTLSKIENKVKDQVRPLVPVIQTTFGEVSMQELLKKRYTVVQLETAENSTDGKGNGHSHDHHHEHKHNHNHSTINALKIDNPPEVNRGKLEKWLKKMPANVLLRGKGIISLENNKGLYTFQFSSGKLAMKKLLEEEASNQPTIILIGNSLNRDEILESFNRNFVKTKRLLNRR
ncbi:MAG: CobW family GTP-binding protein [Bacillus sp. (in: firmicutes)]